MRIKYADNKNYTYTIPKMEKHVLPREIRVYQYSVSLDALVHELMIARIKAPENYPYKRTMQLKFIKRNK